MTPVLPNTQPRLAPPGVTGRLFPSHFIDTLADTLHQFDTAGGPGGLDEITFDIRTHHAWERWWSRVEAEFGPATGVRTLFDVAAMPLFARLGFRARLPRFMPDTVSATLVTPEGYALALLVRPWSDRRSTVWKDAVVTALDLGASWCCVFAPPMLSILPARGHAVRRSLDFNLRDVASPLALPILLEALSASSFDRTPVPVLDHWLALAATQRARVRADLQRGVIDALREFATLLPRTEALTVIYRILFLLFAESRHLVPLEHPIYRDTYTLGSLCTQAIEGTVPCGAWDALAAISRLSRRGGRVDGLDVQPFNGHLFSARSAPSLEGRRDTGRPTRRSVNRDTAVGRTLVALGTRRESTGLSRISYADLGVEELGAVYERVLDPDAGGTPHARKDTGTFYTPQALADFVVHHTLHPIVDGLPSDRILSLRVLDPAMGSGAFLVAALRYLSVAYEDALIREGVCGPADITAADRARFRRLIAQRCLFGVDANPVAVQVARLSLWLATLARARPLSFLDHRLRVGNSLVGAEPRDIYRTGTPSEAGLPLFDQDEGHLESTLRSVLPTLSDISHTPDDSVTLVHRKERAWTSLRRATHPLSRWRRAINLWCAQWFWTDSSRRPSPAEIRAATRWLVNPQSESTALGRHAERWARVADTCLKAHQAFHWSLEFPEAFYDHTGSPRTDAGFDVVLGNPPWEVIRRDARSARRRGRTDSHRDPLVAFVRDSGLYPHCQRGHLNLYQPFLERSLTLTRKGGRVGLVLPWGFAVDDGSAAIRTALFNTGIVDRVVGLDNAKGLFPIHRGLRFGVLMAQPGGPRREAAATFGIRTTEELERLTHDTKPWPVRFKEGVLASVGGPTQRLPDVRTQAELDWLDRLMQAFPRLGDATGWNANFGRELNASEDRQHFVASAGPSRLPVVEGKHIAPFAVDTEDCSQFIDIKRAHRRLPVHPFLRPRLAYRDVSGVGNQFTLIAAVLPRGVVTTHTLFCLRNRIPIEQQHFLCGIFNSRLMNRVVRLLMGGHVTTSLIEQLPVPPWRNSSCQRQIAATAARLARVGRSAAGDRVRNELMAALNQRVEALFENPRPRSSAL